MRRKTTEEFKQILVDKYGDRFTLLSEYHNNCTKVKLRCNECGNIIYKRPAKMMGQDNEGCYICNGKNHYKTKESLQEEVNAKFPDNYIILGDYVRARTPLLVLNTKCDHTYNISPDNLLRGKGCPLCRQSSYEDYVDEYLSLSDFSYIKQKTFDDLKGVGGRSLKFDYYLTDYNICLEIDGQYHYYNNAWENREDYLKDHRNCVQNDAIKNDYCKSHNIPLVRIHYSELHNICPIINEAIKLTPR